MAAGARRGCSSSPGTRIGSRLVFFQRKLGYGGMGEVWAARHTVLDKFRFVVKFLLDFRAYANVEAEERFLREARAAAGLHHANIVDVHDFGNTADGTPYLVMELLNGQTLADLLATTGRVEWPVARQWSCRRSARRWRSHTSTGGSIVTEAEQHFLEEHEDGITCKLLIDFGLAKIVSGHGSGDPQVTRTGVALGMLTYISPEQLRAQRTSIIAPILTRSDVSLMKCSPGRARFRPRRPPSWPPNTEAPELEPRTGGVPFAFIGYRFRAEGCRGPVPDRR